MSRSPLAALARTASLAALALVGSPLAAAELPSADFSSADATTTAPHPVRLVWTRALGAEACPEAPVIEADVARRLGTNPFRPDAPGSIDVHVARDAGVWTALIEDRPTGGAPEGSRVVTSTAESCDSLALAVGLAVALMIRARTNAEATEAPPAPAPPPPAPAPPAPVRPSPPPDETGHVAVFAHALGAFRVLPRAALGPAVSGRVPIGEHASVHAGLALLPEQRSLTAGADVSFGATFGTVSGCYDSSTLSELRLSACASILLGALHVIVRDPEPLDAGARFWGAVSLGLRSDWTLLPPVHLLLGVDAFVPLERRSYVVERNGGTQTAFEEPAWGALASAGLGVEL